MCPPYGDDVFMAHERGIHPDPYRWRVEVMPPIGIDPPMSGRIDALSMALDVEVHQQECPSGRIGRLKCSGDGSRLRAEPS
jgi:hypothetical protein